MAKILLYDIELAPNVSYTWGKYDQNVIAFEQEDYLLCFAYKWLDDKTTKIKALPDYKGYKKGNDCEAKLVADLHALFTEADIIIAHNGDAFDLKKSQGYFLRHNLPPAEVRTVDTLKVVRRQFKLNSNKLDDVGELLGVGKKLNAGGFSTWLGCMEGDAKAWRRMKKYNKMDVTLLERVYLRLRPWIKNHPNLTTYDLSLLDKCPVCQSENIISNGWRVTQTRKYRRYQCKDCHSWSRQGAGDNVVM